ncbi:class I SAM-dependent methyltransferase [Eubacteriales bacterium OttesenSCG-928-K08]|nr:class I SAM-dependent methyltransferase [Eubacteriales bacterium OttesenSCG-928-K08]
MPEAYEGFAFVYDRFMADVNYNEWASYINTLILEANPRAKSIVDCACGTGTLSLLLAQMGYHVIGADASADMLRVAQEKARAAAAQIPFVCQDMRKLLLHKPVDVILSANDGVNYLIDEPDVLAFFQAAHKALNPGGLLLFDISSPYKLENVLGNNTFSDVQEDCAYIWSNNYQKHARLCEMELTCFWKNGMLYERTDELHLQRAHDPQELILLLQSAGFRNIHMYEAFTQAAPKSDSERIQFSAVRL